MATLYTHQDSNIAKTCVLAVMTLLFIVVPTVTFGQTRSYEYARIEINATVNKDTTVDVEERQLFDYNGTYNKGWRSVTLNKVDRISSISVIDGATGQPLDYSWRQLEKTDPANWGKFMTYREGGTQNIEWYYNLSDTTHLWIIKYKVHGGLAFYGDHDELYWNLFTDYDVPVREVTATVRLPEAVSDQKLLTQTFYTSVSDNGTQNLNSGILDERTFFFQSNNSLPKQKLTIAAGWPKGIVDQEAYWKDFARTYWGYILGGLAILLSILYSVLRWYRLEKQPLDARTVVPEYEPPQNLPPAVMGVVLNEGVAKTTWPATIVDLAVRGYVRIEAERQTRSVVGRILVACEVAGLWFSVVYLFFEGANRGDMFTVILIILIIVLLFTMGGARTVVKRSRVFAGRTDYVIVRENSRQGQTPLVGYEKEFLDALFCTGDRLFLGMLFNAEGRFSTREMRKTENQSRAQTLSLEIKMLEKKLDSETEQTTKGYAQGFDSERKRAAILGVLIVIGGILLGLVFSQTNITLLFSSLGITGILFAIAGLIVWWANKDARLNPEGNELKRKILGFKLYLETAEKYRMQNLTPETFEKYLPYAIIFGVEKKWAKAFEGFTIAPPTWYHSAGVAGAGAGFSSGNNSSFSPTAFTSSFSASFASSFASSGGSGASGGGGGAGGGGGGGGGGAS